MKREIIEKIEIPAGIEAEVGRDTIKLKKGGEEIIKKYYGFMAKKESNAILLSCQKATKREKKLLNTLKAHIKNAFNGLEKKFVYKIQVCSVHFPMSIAYDKSKGELAVKNFLGETKPRIAKIPPGVDVKVDKEIISLESSDIDKAGQAAANIERATKIRKRDRRVFQDGCYIIEKPI